MRCYLLTILVESTSWLKWIFCNFTLLSCSIPVQGQTNPKALKLVEEGKKQLEKQKPEQAIKSFESAISLDPSYREAYLELYQIHLNQNNISKAAQTLEQAAKSVSSGKPSILFSLAQLEMSHGIYAEAAKHYSDYLALNSKDSLTRKKAELMLIKANYAIEHIKDSLPVEFKSLNHLINTKVPEYLPSLDAAASTLVFTRRTNSQEDLYISHLIKGDWSTPEAWPRNSANNEGAHVISADGKTIVFTGCGWEDSYGGCDLYISELKLGRWTTPRNIGPAINSRAWESQPSLSANGRSLYFVSDRPGGVGGYDIWKSIKLRNGWSRPTNLGPHVNTGWDEFSPFLHADDISLYFRSDGRPGYGLQDLYLSKKTLNGDWNEAINLGYPLNNYADQGALVVTLDGTTAYFTKQEISASNQLIQSDIVRFNLPALIRANPCIYIEGKVEEKHTNQVLANVPITIAGGINLNRKDTVYSDSEGNFLLVVPAEQTYQVHVQWNGYNLYSDRIFADHHLQELDTLRHIIKLEKLESSDTIPTQPIILRNVLFALNSANLLTESYHELDALADLLKTQPELKVSIHGHTDSTGNAEVNLNLSRQRAQSVYQYLITKGIVEQRLSYQGFGAGRPIKENSSEEGRQQNRRVEFVLSKKSK